MDSLFKIAFNIEQYSSNISEVVKDVLIPLFSVFLGAVLAHCFNIWYDKKRTHKKNKTKLIYLHNKLLTIYLDLKICNEGANSKIAKLENLKLLDVVNSINTTAFEINIKFDDFNFLSLYNRLFVIIIQILKDRLSELNLFLSDYNEFSGKVRKNWYENIEYDVTINSQLNIFLRDIKNFSEDLLGLTHILLKGMDNCYKEYFNENYDFYDLSSNYLEEVFFNNNNLYNLNKNSFDNAWIAKRNINSDIKTLELKTKKIIKDIKTYLKINR